MAHPFLRSAVDAAAAVTLSAAVWFALTSLLILDPLVSASLAGIVFIRVFVSLARLPALPATAQLAFQPVPLEFEAMPEEVLLPEPVTAHAGGRQVVGASAAQTPGEMRAKIERHLQVRRSPAPDAADELREALAELRRAAG